MYKILINISRRTIHRTNTHTHIHSVEINIFFSLLTRSPQMNNLYITYALLIVCRVRYTFRSFVFLVIKYQ